MLHLNSCQKVLLFVLAPALMIVGCKKQLITLKSDTPHSSFLFNNWRRLYGNGLEVTWTSINGLGGRSPVKYSFKLNGKIVATGVIGEITNLNDVLPTLDYDGWIIAADDAGPRDSVHFNVPAERIFSYSSSVVVSCGTNTGLAAWIGKIGAGSLPAIVGDTVFVEGGNGDGFQEHTLYALNAKTGSIIWSKPGNLFLEEDVSEVINEKGLLYAVSSRNLSVHRSSDGKMLWQMGLHENDRPFINDNTLLAEGVGGSGNLTSYLRGYDATTGMLKWSYEPLNSDLSKPFEKDKIVYVIVCRGTWPLLTGTVFSLKALDVNSGAIKWQTVEITGGPGTVSNGSRPFIIGSTVYVSIETDNGDKYVYAYNKDSGRFQWSVRCDPGRFAGDSLGLLVITYNKIICLDPNNGKTIWMKPSYSTVVPTADKIYVGATMQGFTGDSFKIMDRRTGEEDTQTNHYFGSSSNFTLVIDGKTYYSPESGMYKGN